MGASHGRGAGLGLGPWRGRIAAPAAGPLSAAVCAVGETLEAREPLQAAQLVCGEAVKTAFISFGVMCY